MKTTKQGFIGLIIMIVVALILAQVVFKIDVISYLRSLQHSNGVLGYFVRFVILVWDKFLIAPVTFVFDIIKNVAWAIYHAMTGWVDKNSATSAQ
jgi:hypothetical protein